MFALDSDTFSDLQRGRLAILNQLLSVPADQIWIPAVVAEEQVRGRLAVINKVHTLSPARAAFAYLAFTTLLQELAQYQILPHTEEAEALYRSWPASVKRVGAHDCRIAASAIVAGMTLVTRNRSHFSHIPGIRLTDLGE